MINDYFVIAGKVQGTDEMRYLSAYDGCYVWRDHIKEGIFLENMDMVEQILNDEQFTKNYVNTSNGHMFPPYVFRILTGIHDNRQEHEPKIAEIFILKLNIDVMSMYEHVCEVKIPTGWKYD